MDLLKDYVARTEGTCGKGKHVIVTFKFDRKEEAIKKILEKSILQRSYSEIVYELEFQEISFRLYGSGKAIFRDLKNEKELDTLLLRLLS